MRRGNKSAAAGAPRNELAEVPADAEDDDPQSV
jgi:hypothetical protein